MVSAKDVQAQDAQEIVRYLVGSLPVELAEHYDERSIVDDDFAAKLSVVEYDLIDAYVRGELSGETLDRFKSHYLSLPTNRQKVRFAETWFSYHNRSNTLATPS